MRSNFARIAILVAAFGAGLSLPAQADSTVTQLRLQFPAVGTIRVGGQPELADFTGAISVKARVQPPLSPR